MSVTSAKGFTAAGVYAGLRSTEAPDVALVVNNGPSDAAAGVFTTNRFQAAPVLWSRQVLQDGQLKAVLLNAGGANACTGPDGFADTHVSAERTAIALNIGAAEVAVCSTGLIGVRLPMPELLAGIDDAATSLADDGGPAAAEAIRTTDTRAKTAAVTADAGWTVGGMAKGAGMLAPEMATMLCVITTDAIADAAVLDAILREAMAHSFDRIDSDGCMSTNDTVLLLASGASEIAPSRDELADAVTEVCHQLSQQLLADAEGASKDVAIDVRGAATDADALEVGRAIARSNLLKCALFGNDPNWGRVLSAIGTTKAAFESDRVDVAINGIQICRAGAAGDPREGVDLTGRKVEIVVELHAGDAATTVYTNDLTFAYVEENSAYSS